MWKKVPSRSCLTRNYREIVHEYPKGVRERYADIFEEFPSLYSKEYEKSFRRNHPGLIDAHIRTITGIRVKPGFGKFIHRQSIQKLPRTITY